MRSFLISVLFFLSVVVSAQDMTSLERFCRNVADSCVEMTYEYTVRLSGINTAGQGKLAAQGGKWKMEGNGVKMYCDSVVVWIIDQSSKEVVIESADAGASAEYMTNPAVMFMRIGELFDTVKVLDKDDGRVALYILRPKNSGKIDYLNVEILKKDALLMNGEFAMKDGTLVKVRVDSMILTPLRPVSAFRPDRTFDSSWIVTDMR